MAAHEIRIENARTNNLQGISCRIPLYALTVITGVSGSGKSSLAFDTLYAEGQRRYVTSLSSYARQFLERLPRPEVDSISNLPPAIAIEQRKRAQNARSTVGSASEMLDHLRLLFAKIGETRCPNCDRTVLAGDVSGVVSQIVERFAGERIALGTPIQGFANARDLDALREELLRAGYRRLLEKDAHVVDLDEISLADFERIGATALLLLDRLVVRDRAGRARLAEAVSAGFRRGEGRVDVVDGQGEHTTFLEGFACDSCGLIFQKPTPALLSFNHSLGACAVCSGFGRIAEIDWHRVVPDPARSIEEGAVAPFRTPMGQSLQEDLVEACLAEDIPVDCAFEELDAGARRFVFEGDDGEWYGVQGYFDWLADRRYRVQARVQIARYRVYVHCEVCDGTRLNAEARSVRVRGREIGEIARLSIAQLSEWVGALDLSTEEAALCGRLLELLRKRIDTVLRVGLDYLTLDRQVRTLSAGEAQRIQLATALGGNLTDVLYVLDEPSVGLHARDMQRLLQVLRSIRDQGNTLVLVEHAPEIIEAADHIIDIGPGAGAQGGRVVAAGPAQAVLRDPASITGVALREPPRLRDEHAVSRAGPKALRVLGARGNNLTGIDVTIPLGRLVVVTGVSGAGKSTLVYGVLVAHLRERLEGVRAARSDLGDCDSIEGAEHLDRVVEVDQSPASRNSRSNAATLSKAFDAIRQLFAGTREARIGGLAAGFFSFNVAGGRCEVCEGSGFVVIDMQFLDDVRLPCEECRGTRYRAAALAIRVQGHTIADVLAMSVDGAREAFADQPKIVRALEPLARVGLGYLGLGQPLSTLSGGEHQRLRLALALREGAARTLYVLDEPSTGLHRSDIRVLLGCLDELVEAGGSVLVVEHNLDIILHADTVIDLGPEAGAAGGRLVASGPPERIARVPGSHTGAALAEYLNRSG